jgi:hypothetical protein
VNEHTGESVLALATDAEAEDASTVIETVEVYECERRSILLNLKLSFSKHGQSETETETGQWSAENWRTHRFGWEGRWCVALVAWSGTVSPLTSKKSISVMIVAAIAEIELSLKTHEGVWWLPLWGLGSRCAWGHDATKV